MKITQPIPILLLVMTCLLATACMKINETVTAISPGAPGPQPVLPTLPNDSNYLSPLGVTTLTSPAHQYQLQVNMSVTQSPVLTSAHYVLTRLPAADSTH